MPKAFGGKLPDFEASKQTDHDQVELKRKEAGIENTYSQKDFQELSDDLNFGKELNMSFDDFIRSLEETVKALKEGQTGLAFDAPGRKL